jgi:protein-L-isoaspartate(D-aspartate) O-methyltransferase
MATMLERLDCGPGSNVLEIGTGTGYNAAILACLTSSDGAVTSIELDPTIATEAQAHLGVAGIDGVRVLVGDGWLGEPALAPYDRIIVTAGVSDIAPAWVAQLDSGGRLVAPLWLGPGFELAVTFERRGTHLVSLAVDWCGFMRLRGDYAGPEATVVAGQWSATIVDAQPNRVRQLIDLVSGPAASQPVPPLARWWFGRLALEEPGAIHLVAMADWRHRAWGVFDPEATGLSVVDGDSLISYGSPGARNRLLAFLDTCRPLDLGDLAIEAVPVAEAVSSGAVVLNRPNHRLLVRELR